MGHIILQALTAHSLLEGHMLELYERQAESSNTNICDYGYLRIHLM
jgi:hypothetical protein